MRFVSLFSAVALTAALPTASLAVSFSSLATTMGTVSIGDVTFSEFEGFEVVGASARFDDLDVTASATANSVSVIFTYAEPYDLGLTSEFAFTEFAIDFTARVNSESTRRFDVMTLAFDTVNGVGAGGGTEFIIESTMPSLTVVFEPDSTSTLSDTQSLPFLSSAHSPQLALEGQASPGTGDNVVLGAFSVTYTLDPGIVAPVPLPATLGFLLLGLGTVGAVARRKP